ncbi:MAG: SIMPL domain-containing protein [Bacteroidales bacterium]|jgi:uncharacterized protein YggE|nr:SIMPL domain-containing protein [Bacteroidales bacterium]
MKKIAISLFCALALAACTTKTIQEQPRTVWVSGTGIVRAQPDMVLLRVSFSHTAPTTKAAKQVLNQTMQHIVDLLKREGIDDKFIQTTALNYFTATEWHNGRSVRVGQTAQQSLAIQVTDIINKPERLSAVIDGLTAIERVEVNNISFDIENKTELFKKSRELAFQKAQEKAAQLAELSGQTLGKALSITEVPARDDVAQTRSMANMKEVAESASFDQGAAVLPSGEQGVSLEINVSFELLP